MNVVAELARLAADAEPPALDELTARRMVERATASAVHVAPRRRSPLRWLPALALAMVAAGAVGWWLRPVRAPELLHVALPTGDRLVGLEGTRFDLARLEPADRRVVLHGGTLLADVAHVVPEQHFEIATAHLTAIAKGTVFSVEAEPRRSRVIVYEGVVDVVQDGGHHVVPAGGVWSSDTAILAAAPEQPRVLAADITEAIARRAHAVTLAAAPLVPVPAPPPPPAPPPHPVAHVTVPHSPPPPPAPEPSLDAMLADARTALAAGKLDDALAIAQRAAARGAQAGAWRVLTADALRGLGRADDAATAYEQAARELAGSDAIEAGYSAAYLRFKELKDPTAALAVIEATQPDAAGSPLEERGLALHVAILEALARKGDAKPLAQRYLEHFPQGELRVEMQQLAR